jgi:hypothetical protein
LKKEILTVWKKKFWQFEMGNFDSLKKEILTVWNGKFWQFEKRNFDCLKKEILTVFLATIWGSLLHLFLRIFSRNLILHNFFRYTFVDLAQIVCKIPKTYDEKEELSSDDDYFEGYASEPSTMPTTSRLHRVKTGGSLSLSEHEFDSEDDEMDMPRPLRMRTSSTSESTRSVDTSGASPLAPPKILDLDKKANTS